MSTSITNAFTNPSLHARTRLRRVLYVSSYTGACSDSSSSEEQYEEETESSCSESSSVESHEEDAKELEARVDVYGWERGGGAGTSMS